VGNLEDPPGEAAIHVSTYRLQFNRRFTFADAARFSSLSSPARHQPLLRFPFSESPSGQQPRIRYRLLGDHYGTILEQQELKLVFDAGLGE
jgi:hypothetical protein